MLREWRREFAGLLGGERVAAEANFTASARGDENEQAQGYIPTCDRTTSGLPPLIDACDRSRTRTGRRTQNLRHHLPDRLSLLRRRVLIAAMFHRPILQA